MNSMELRKIEEAKVKCAERFFTALNEKIDSHKVKYGVVQGFEGLMGIVG